MRVGDAVAIVSSFVNAWSGTYLDWHKHHVSWHRMDNTRNHTILIISLVQVENHRCIHTMICFVNTAGGISILAVLVNLIIDICMQIVLLLFSYNKWFIYWKSWLKSLNINIINEYWQFQHNTIRSRFVFDVQLQFKSKPVNALSGTYLDWHNQH